MGFIHVDIVISWLFSFQLKKLLRSFKSTLDKEDGPYKNLVLMVSTTEMEWERQSGIYNGGVSFERLEEIIGTKDRRQCDFTSKECFGMSIIHNREIKITDR